MSMIDLVDEISAVDLLMLKRQTKDWQDCVSGYL